MVESGVEHHNPNSTLFLYCIVTYYNKIQVMFDFDHDILYFSRALNISFADSDRH
jgi:hypothetical protein